MRVLVVGGGIGGLTLGLTLHRVGIADIHIFEGDRDLTQPGVGLAIQPPAASVLAELELDRAVAEAGVEITELVAYTNQGEEVWREPRGRGAGGDAPQYAIHRGRLLLTLIRALEDRLGQERLHTGHRLRAASEFPDQVVIELDAPDGRASVTGDVLVGADGVTSTVRRLLHPEEPPPHWSGAAAWRGVTTMEAPFEIGRMVMLGNSERLFWAFAIRHPDEDGNAVLSWAAHARLDPWRTTPEPGWASESDVDDLLEMFASVANPEVSPTELIRRSDAIVHHPVVSRPPLPSWSTPRMTLLGDAAHPLPPVGSVGASQAIIDAQILAQELGASADTATGLTRYESRRRPVANRLIELSSVGGPFAALDLAESQGTELDRALVGRIFEDFRHTADAIQAE